MSCRVPWKLDQDVRNWVRFQHTIERHEKRVKSALVGWFLIADKLEHDYFQRHCQTPAKEKRAPDLDHKLEYLSHILNNRTLILKTVLKMNTKRSIAEGRGSV